MPSGTATKRLLSLQVPWLVQMAKQALAEGKCVVIGLQSTGEARTADVVSERGEELDDFVSGPRVSSSPYIPLQSWQPGKLPTD